jgi:hypothetical protein
MYMPVNAATAARATIALAASRPGRLVDAAVVDLQPATRAAQHQTPNTPAAYCNYNDGCGKWRTRDLRRKPVRYRERYRELSMENPEAGKPPRA